MLYVGIKSFKKMKNVTTVMIVNLMAALIVAILVQKVVKIANLEFVKTNVNMDSIL